LLDRLRDEHDDVANHIVYIGWRQGELIADIRAVIRDAEASTPRDDRYLSRLQGFARAHSDSR
jgi:hypothetical protein